MRFLFVYLFIHLFKKKNITKVFCHKFLTIFREETILAQGY